MELPINPFKRALQARTPQIGLWVGFADPYVAEALAISGFDWLLIDGEHAPNDLRSMLGQLQAIAPYPVHPIVRPPIGDVALIKQLLDIGAQTLLIPMVENAEQAARMVAATRYPPLGVRGVGSALARSSRWNQIDGYLLQADQEMCVLVQVETVTALAEVARIAAVDGVDGVFFGPADLSASMGLLNQPGHADVQAAIISGIESVRSAGKAAGVLAADPELARRYLGAGATFVAVGVDTTLLVRAAKTCVQLQVDHASAHRDQYGLLMIKLDDPSPLRFDNDVDGQWIAADSGRRIDGRNPASGELVSTVPDVGVAEAQRAVAGADQTHSLGDDS